MNFEITNHPKPADTDFIAAQTRKFNDAFVKNDFSPLCVFVRDDAGELIAGLNGKTYWNYLEISFLWVHNHQRGSGIGTKLIQTTESEAVKRGCKYSMLDTYSFQALPFYLRHGYEEFGRLEGFCGEYTRYFLRKQLL
ncbi:MAG: GNAT family N-acetyltransferase [Verrucomicrobiales bacterium]|nr:GNAT family N-acetyltransferase [Verrucomicrobiales bacterium]